MPELPEVETTTKTLGTLLPNLKIRNIHTEYNSQYFYGKNQIKDPKYFKSFKNKVIGKKIKSTSRIGKNVLIHLEDNVTILVHMKMTGHLLYGKYAKIKNEWKPQEKGPLEDKFNGWIRLVFELSNNKHLVLSDLRKFAKVTLLEDEDMTKIGPEPFDIKINEFIKIVNSKKNKAIKTILMDQELISGIGNIYSDEALWLSKINPERKASTIKEFGDLFKNIKKILKKGIDFGGDSMSDYRTPTGEKGKFQEHHRVYQRKGLGCFRKECKGKIIRKVINGRSSHFCNTCQK